ncbi:MAG: histidine--tRNA ligase [Planctomycetota bacterium]
MSDEQVQSLAGTEDRLPGDWNLWNELHDAARRQFEFYGYGRVYFPVIEDTRLFVKGTGETTDIVEKQMYTIDTGEEESITLRPEGTPSTVRAYLERDLHKKQRFQKLWYAGPMFRRERPQKGRLRQFHQIGVEAIGGASPLLDAESILLASDIFHDAGLEDCEVHLNTIGCTECRPTYHRQLHAQLDERRQELCEDCQNRLDRNVLRVLDCKEEQCREVTADIADIREYLCDRCDQHYTTVKSSLDAENLQYQEDPHLVRGLDYYSRTVFEIKHAELGARDTICGGGRYDGLVEHLGGPSLPCVGFGIGVEATLLAMEAELDAAQKAEEPALDVYVVCFDTEARKPCFRQLQALRAQGLSADMDFEQRSAKAQMRMADRMNARYCYLIGGRELEDGQVLVKEMDTGEQWNVQWDEAARSTAQRCRD